MSRLFEPQLQGSIQSLAAAASKPASCSYRVLSFLQESEHLEPPIFFKSLNKSSRA